jgi:hypothetical protein
MPKKTESFLAPSGRMYHQFHNSIQVFASPEDGEYLICTIRVPTEEEADMVMEDLKKPADL